jgi:1-aminocyclopropane-1-carboxylate deaminase/D-cysteine desulfhydrase-like pyridoxal-dependent ACC family enzyme
VNIAVERSGSFADRFPKLSRDLARVALGSFPTPLGPAPSLCRAIGGLAGLEIKDDGHSHGVYGGNKVRKLEYLLAEALARGAKEVLTFGFTGSNHAAATAVHAAALGLKSISMLLPQVGAPYVADNLATSRAAGAEIHRVANEPSLAAGTLVALVKHRTRTGAWPYVIAPGGSSPLGTVGFVAAAFELATQLAGRDGDAIPERVYVAFGSCGTAVGLALGAALAGLPIRIVAVRVTEQRHANARKAESLWRRTAALLHRVDPSVPLLPFRSSSIEIRDEYFGEAYASPTAGAQEAIALMQRHEGIELDVAYTGKALACLVDDARAGRIAGSRAVFWNTLNAKKKNPFGSTDPKGFFRDQTPSR